MNRLIFARTIVVVGLALAYGRATFAHHSSAMYDRERLVTIRGVVKEFRWTNPHVSMIVEADASDKNPGGRWVVEATSPGNLSRNGWRRTSLNAGDRVTVVAAPLRDGGHGAYCESVTMVDKGTRLEC